MPASPLVRLAAFLLDQVFLVPVFALVLPGFGLPDLDWNLSPADLPAELRALAEAAWGPFLAVEFAYFALFEASAMRGTPAKWFLGIAVGDNGGDPLGLVHTALRAAGKLATVAAAPLLLLSLYHPRHQAVYDRLLGTTVVQRGPRLLEPPVDDDPEPAVPQRYEGLIEDWPGPARG